MEYAQIKWKVPVYDGVGKGKGIQRALEILGGIVKEA